MNHAENLKVQFVDACEKQQTVFERRLENWIRSNKAGYAFASGHCFSAEYRYRSVRVKESNGVSIPIDEKDAALVDRAYRQLAMQVPRAAYIIKATYFKNETPGKIARIFGCRLSDLSNRLHWSLKMLENRLHYLERKV